jgi:hypothetical protein
VKKLLPVSVLSLAAAALGWVALRAPAQDYVAPKATEVQAHVPAPRALRSAPPEGCAIRTLDVAGMCCTGCTGKLHARLMAEPGVVDAAVDFEQGIAQAIVPVSSDAVALERALTFGKYTATLRP